jgi:hypothetical protein
MQAGVPCLNGATSALTGTYLSVAALKGQTIPLTTLFRLSRGSIAFKRRRGRLFQQMNMQWSVMDNDDYP